CTGLAVVMRVTGTFGGAGATGLCADPTQLPGPLAVANHQNGAQAAQVRAVAIQLDAAGHHAHILFAQTGGGAMLAGLHAAHAGLDARLVVGVGHGRSSGRWAACAAGTVGTRPPGTGSARPISPARR